MVARTTQKIRALQDTIRRLKQELKDATRTLKNELRKQRRLQ